MKIFRKQNIELELSSIICDKIISEIYSQNSREISTRVSNEIFWPLFFGNQFQFSAGFQNLIHENLSTK